MFIFDIKNILVAIAGVVDIIQGFVVYAKNAKSRANFWFFLLIIGIGFWALSMIFYRGLPDVEESMLWARMLYLAAATIPFIFLYFTAIFPDEKTPFSFTQRYVLPVPFLIIAYIALLPGGLIKNVLIITQGERIIVFDPYLHVMYGIYIAGYFLFSYINLFKKFFSSEGILKIQITYVLVGTLISTTIGMITNLLLPMLGIFALNWAGQVGVMVMVGAISYAIIKHHLFNMKVIATELLTFGVWIFLFIQIILAKDIQDAAINTVLFTIVIFFGIFLIRSVIKEVEQREKLEELTAKLEDANSELKKLDQAKSEFISIASHQLRAPLTVIKGYTSMILEGSLGQITDTARNALQKTYISTEQLVKLVASLLDLSRIESGKIRYEFKPANIAEIIQKVIGEFKTNADKKKVTLNFKNNAPNLPALSLDTDKIREVIVNFIDNAIKYTKENTSVDISLDKNKKGWVRFSVTDHGFGIKKEDIKKLFIKFNRTDEARAHDPNGMGIGLYFVKHVIEDHGGKVGVESAGAGKGSMFFAELPVK